MVATELMRELQDRFAFLKDDKRILGIILFGSQITGDSTPRSDFDICIVTRDKDTHAMYQNLANIWENVPVTLLKYDVRMFHELPLYIQGRIIEQGVVILARDEPELYEYLYPYRKRWDEQKFRQQLSPEEEASFFS